MRFLSLSEQGSLSKPISKSTAAPSSSDSNRLILQSEGKLFINCNECFYLMQLVYKLIVKTMV